MHSKRKAKKHEQALEDAPSHCPLAASVTVVRVIPPMTTVGWGIDPPLFPSPAMTSKDASFCYPSCSGSNDGWRHSPHDGSGEGIYPPPSPLLQ